jgi:hypothetical protein
MGDKRKRSKAGRAKPVRARDIAAAVAGQVKSTEVLPASNGVPGARVDRTAARHAAARLYGQGYKRKEIARILKDHIISDLMKTRPLEQQIQAATHRLKTWENSQAFRDMVYEKALIQLDLQSGEILSGVAKKAKRGRVDAARLVLEVTGRHSAKHEAQPTQIALVINGIPRPGNVQAVTAAGQVELDADGELVQDDEA